MPKVLISDSMSPAAIAIFKDRGVEVDVRTGLKPDALKEIIGDYDGLAIRSSTKVTADLLATADRLKVVGRAGIGVDNVDIAAATARGVIVMNTPFGNSITTAEHAIAMMFSLARDIPEANASTQAGKWEKSRFMGTELTNKVLGVVGCGNIGSIVADRAKGLRMRVVAYDPFLSVEKAKALGIEKVDLDDLLARSDIITLHTPLTDATRNIICAKTLAKTKKGVFLINCARGGLVVEEDLKAALESGQVAGAAIDVYREEPAKTHPLFGMPRVICTPHLGASTKEAQENVALQLAEQMSDYLLQGAISNALNMPSVSAEEAPKLGPYMALAGQLGSFAGQLTETGLKRVSVSYEGQVAELNTRPLTAVLLEGLLKPFVETVNMVNAPLIAKERNIEVIESKTQQSTDYQTYVRLVVTTDRRSREVAGTLFGGEKPRIASVKGIAIEAELCANMLYVTNKDRPGFIGRLGSVLGEAGVNIATFNLGRAASGEDAIALISVDQPVDEALLEKVRAIPNVVQVVTLRF